jgi:hypothetical protein
MDVGRDVFARGQYRRFHVHNVEPVGFYQAIGCAWCGQHPRLLFSYVWYADDQRTPKYPDDKFFCNLECFRAYSD